MTTETYNGWTNKPTWLIKLWIDNDQSEQEYWLEQARECLALPASASGVGQPSYGAYRLADMLKDAHEERFDDWAPDFMKAGLYADLMSYALAVVNWDEIARHLIDDSSEN